MISGPHQSAEKGRGEKVQRVQNRDFLDGSNTLLNTEPPTHDTPSPGDFSWWWSRDQMPDEGTPPMVAAQGPNAATPLGRQQASEPPQGSTLARYIHRFRYGEPQSRASRAIEQLRSQPLSSPSDFWWLSSSSANSSTPKGRGGGKLHNRDWKTEDLQKRAAELIDQSECFSNPLSEAAEITDGSTTESSTRLLPDEDKYCYRRSPGKVGKENMGSWKKSEPRHPLSPEEDILYQWRLRRKMEQAQNRAAVLVLSNSRQSSAPPSPAKVQLEDFDPDSKLAEFRSQILHRTTLERDSLGRQGASIVSGLGGSQAPVKGVATVSQGVDPMPQSRSTQTSPVEAEELARAWDTASWPEEQRSPAQKPAARDRQQPAFRQEEAVVARVPNRKAGEKGPPKREDDCRRPEAPLTIDACPPSPPDIESPRQFPVASLGHVRQLTFPNIKKSKDGEELTVTSRRPCTEEMDRRGGDSPVTHAIHQVVADRFFSVPVIHRIGADHSTPTPPTPPPERAQADIPEKDSGSISSSLSSESEGSDCDELLQMLIGKRKFYQKQLEKIDLLLVNSRR